MQKVRILIALCILSCTVGCFAVVTRTLTIDNTMLDQIRLSLVSTSSNYDALLNSALLRGSDDYIPDSYITPPIDKPDDYDTVLSCVNRLKNGTFGDLGIQNTALGYIEADLHDLSTSIFMEGYFTNVNVDGPRRALDLIYLTVNTAMLYDCLYYEYSYITQSSKDALKYTLEHCITLIEGTEYYFLGLAGNPITNGRAYWQSGYEGSSQSDYPAFVLYQYRYAMYASLGLAAILLHQTAVIEGNASQAQTMLYWVNFVDDKLRNEMLPAVFPLSSQSDSMIDFYASKIDIKLRMESNLLYLSHSNWQGL